MREAGVPVSRPAKALPVTAPVPAPWVGTAPAQLSPVPAPAPRVRAAVNQSTSTPVPTPQVGVTGVSGPPLHGVDRTPGLRGEASQIMADLCTGISSSGAVHTVSLQN